MNKSRINIVFSEFELDRKVTDANFVTDQNQVAGVFLHQPLSTLILKGQ